MTSQCPPQTDAFRDLSNILASRDGRALEIEILPPAFGPLLQDGCSIGITKKYLVQAFVAARRIFFDTLKSNSDDHGVFQSPKRSEPKPENDEADKILAIASEVILLFDCEHLTACNWRKRRLVALIKLGHGKEEVIQALNTELSLMTTYLCSPLHRHTKSPTLWQHRQWVQTHLIRLRKQDIQSAEELLQAELSIALRAGELHPRNYYAFSHMRQMHRMLSKSGEGEAEDWSVQLGQSIINPTLDWSLAHPADISGLMFLFNLLNAVPETTIRLNTIRKVACFALDIGWEGEGVWMFVDLAVRNFSLGKLLRDSQTYPWDVLLDSALLDTMQHSEGKPCVPWRMWLDRARIHWAHTRQSTETPQS